MQKNSTTRFSDRVENYVKYRPSYPEEIIGYLKEENVLTKESAVADVGSGTGILTELFLKYCTTVYGIEPNKEMREAGESFLKDYTNFVSVTGSAESMPLEDKSVELIAAGQAFHWFDIPGTKKEFMRILSPGGNVVLIWNVRRVDSTPFLKAYEKLLIDYGTDYQQVRHENVDTSILSEFFGGKYVSKSFYNEQVFGYEGLNGRLLSSSYSPARDQPGYFPMLEELKNIFDKYNNNGKVIFEYDTELHLGKFV